LVSAFKLTISNELVVTLT